MNITFILVEPAVPENVGAAARAIKTMGFSSLALIGSNLHLSEKARTLAHGAHDILENAKTASSLDDLCRDFDFAIATTARRRKDVARYVAAEKLADALTQKGGTVKSAGLVFGREDRGLLNHEIERCDMVTNIPLHAPYPSLNLAQAVMVFAYELRSLSLLSKIRDHTAKTKEGEYQTLKTKVSRILTEIGIDETARRHRLIIDRLGLISDYDIRLLHTVCSFLEQKLEG